jgi:hypothetical protein
MNMISMQTSNVSKPTYGMYQYVFAMGTGNNCSVLVNSEYLRHKYTNIVGTSSNPIDSYIWQANVEKDSSKGYVFFISMFKRKTD